MFETERTLFDGAREGRRNPVGAAYGQAKLDVMVGPMARFVAAFSQLKHVDFDAEVTDDAFPVDTVELGALRDVDLKPLDHGFERRCGRGWVCGRGRRRGARATRGRQSRHGQHRDRDRRPERRRGDERHSLVAAASAAARSRPAVAGVAAGTMVLSGVASLRRCSSAARSLAPGGEALRDAEANEAEVRGGRREDERRAHPVHGSVARLAEREHDVLDGLASGSTPSRPRWKRIVARERDYRRLALRPSTVARG